MRQPSNDVVAVWIVAADRPLDAESIAAALVADEQRRAAGSAGEEFAQARAALRLLLGAYLHREPKSLVLEEEGKPHLADKALEFSVAHAPDLTAIAIARCPVGADIEPTEEMAASEVDDLIDLVLSPAEIDELRSLPPDARLPFYLRTWTRKEALLKGTGEGISTRPLPEVKIESFGADRWIARTPVGEWHGVDLNLDEGHVGAVALAGARPQVELRRITGDRD